MYAMTPLNSLSSVLSTLSHVLQSTTINHQAVVSLVWVTVVGLVWVACKSQPFHYMHELYCLNVLTWIVLCSFHLSLSISLYCQWLSLLSCVGHLYQLTLIVDAKEYPQSVAV